MKLICIVFLLNCVFFLSSVDNRLYDTTNQLKTLNLKLTVENEQLRTGGGTPHTVANGTPGAAHAAKIQALEKRLMAQMEELTDLHKRKGENSQMIVDLNVKIDKLNKLLLDKDNR